MSLKDIQSLVFDKVTNINSSTDLNQIIKADHLDVETRVAVYQSGYQKRLKEIIYDDFAVTTSVCDQITNNLIDEFISYRDSKSFTLFRYGANFRNFIFEKFGYSSLPGQLAEFEWRQEESYFLENGLENKHFYPVFSIDESKKIRLSDTIFLFSSKFHLSEIFKRKKFVSSKDETFHMIWTNKGHTYFEELTCIEYKFLSCLKVMNKIGEVLDFFYEHNFSENDILDLFNQKLPELLRLKVLLFPV